MRIRLSQLRRIILSEVASLNDIGVTGGAMPSGYPQSSEELRKLLVRAAGAGPGGEGRQFRSVDLQYVWDRIQESAAEEQPWADCYGYIHEFVLDVTDDLDLAADVANELTSNS